MAEYALKLASYILKSNIKDSKFYAIIDNYPGKKERRKVYFNKEKLYDYLGFEIPEKEVDRILKRLPLEYAGDNYYYVDNSRKDINIEVDVVEEIAKFFGYDNIIPEDLTVAITPYENKQKFLFDFASKMATLGFNEVKNFSLTGEKNEDSVEVINPLNEELAYMRTNMLSGLLKVLDYNEKRGMNEHFYAESGKVYKMKDGKYFEKYVLCALAKGNVFDGIFDKKQADYYYMKGIVENILSGYSLEFLPNDDNDKLHPGVSAKIVIDETLIGYVGKVHPLIYGKDAYYFEIYPESVPEKSSKIVKDISQNPSVKFDLSLLVPDTLKYGDVLNLILDMNVKELESIKVYDFYKGENIPEGKFSITFRMLFNDTEKTLNDKKVNKIVGNILKRLEKGGITLRDK
jgi:phenylalanyl-tRNA synthetase beta chain